MKIFNDPIYGIINYPYEILYDLIDHRYFQRLRRISQMGLSHYVYPGAKHTRFQHALGALHLMTKAIDTLRWKNIEISEDEAEAVSIAILLHDIGHGPFSHALEGILLPFHHEELSLAYMEELNEEFNGKLSLSIEIFTGKYYKTFLHELVSSQLDMDRLDYLIRDSYFTGVAEGVIGYDRIIKMLNVKNNHLVVEEKGIYSVEKFLMSRRLMYWQAYLHKTSIAAEQMLILFFRFYMHYIDKGDKILKKSAITELIKKSPSLNINELIPYHANIDDTDVTFLLKYCQNINNYILQFISKSLLYRKIFMISLQSKEFICENLEKTKTKLISLGIPEEFIPDLTIRGKETNLEYRKFKDEIRILNKNGEVIPFSKISDYHVTGLKKELYFLCYPKCNVLK